MLGNQESQGEPQDQLASHLEPDQEVAAVLGKGETEIKTTWWRIWTTMNETPSLILHTSYVSTWTQDIC